VDLPPIDSEDGSVLQGMSVSQKIGAQGYVECSARTGEGVCEVFQTATRKALAVRSQPSQTFFPLISMIGEYR